jgi:hypothetical protein
MKRKTKTIALFLDGKEHIKDVVSWALTANMTIEQAKEYLSIEYTNLNPVFKVV